MDLLSQINERWKEVSYPFLIHGGHEYAISDLVNSSSKLPSSIQKGDVVALIGDFNPQSISTLLQLVDLGAIIVPLTRDTKSSHEYYIASSLANVIMEEGELISRSNQKEHPLLEQLRRDGKAGLILFSTGTTGRPKAILHDFSRFLDRYAFPRPALRSLGFLLFDHIGGINTLLHTLFNKGVVIVPQSRSVGEILELCDRYQVELLPTSPTFLRMMLLSGELEKNFPKSIKIITYGTERMDQLTLNSLCSILPDVDFRQTYGMSELGIMRVKSRARDSLFMRIGGQGIETRVNDSVLEIRSDAAMLGYLNAPAPFDSEGWYNTGDIVEEDGDGYYRIVGRMNDFINVGGLKFLASEVENVVLGFPGIAFVKVEAKSNPITGQHVEITIQTNEGEDVSIDELKKYLKGILSRHMIPKRIKFGKIGINHRFKRS